MRKAFAKLTFYQTAESEAVEHAVGIEFSQLAKRKHLFKFCRLVETRKQDALGRQNIARLSNVGSARKSLARISKAQGDKIHR